MSQGNNVLGSWDEGEKKTKHEMRLGPVIITYRAPDGAKKTHLNILQHFLLDLFSSFDQGGGSLGPLTKVKAHKNTQKNKYTNRKSTRKQNIALSGG